MRKLTAVILSVCLCASFGACGADKQAGGQPDGSVTVKWLMPGPGEQKDSRKVWEEFNKRLKTYEGMENVVVDIEVIDPSDYSQKFMLMQTSGEKIDIVQTYTINFAAEARKGTFLELGDIINQKAPNLERQLPDWIWGLGKVDGKQYIVPNYQQMCSALWGIKTPKELADQYLDVESMQKVFASKQTFDEDCYLEMEKYLEALHADGKIWLGANMSTQAVKGFEHLVENYAIRIHDDHPTVINWMQSPEVELLFKYRSRWLEKGYIRKDILSAEVSNDNGKDGGNVLWIGQVWKGTEEQDKATHGMEVTSVPITDYPYIPSVAPAGGTAIMQKSQHPDESLRVIELMNSSQGEDIYNLLVYGLEGEHYNRISEDKIETLGYVGGSTSNSNYGLWKWVVGNTVNALDTTADIDGWKEYVFDELNQGEKTIYSKLIGFVPDLSKISSNMAQVKAVETEYGDLGYGSEADFQSEYQAFLTKLEKCGNDKVIEELQRQVDEFLLQNN